MNTTTMPHDRLTHLTRLRAHLAKSQPIEQIVLNYHEDTYGSSADAATFSKRLRILEMLCKHSLTVIDQERIYRGPHMSSKAYETVSTIFRETVEMLEIIQHS